MESKRVKTEDRGEGQVTWRRRCEDDKLRLTVL
jgi:hypothetical protein